MDIEQAAARLGIPPRELAEMYETPAGWVYVNVSGSRLVDVPADRPDADGKTGLMFLAAPHANYRGLFPVYAQPEADEDVVEVEEIEDRTTEVSAPRRGRPRKGTA